MNNNNNDNSTKILDIYKDKSNSFHRIFYILIRVSIFFMFIIFIPYISIVSIERNIRILLNETQSIYNNLVGLQTNLEEQKAIIYADKNHIKNFFIGLITNYADNRENCK